MARPDRYEFMFFSQRKDDGSIELTDVKGFENMLILPRHPETNELDKYYLQSMLMCFDGSSDFRSNEILDAFPVLSLTTDKNDKFFKLSLARLHEFSRGKIKQDEYIGASIKHLFIMDQIAPKSDESKLLNECLKKVEPEMYRQDSSDTVDCEGYDLSRVASYIPTSKYKRMKILKGWIEGALHYYEYSILFFDVRFVGYDDFNENIIDIKLIELCQSGNLFIKTRGPFLLHDSGLYYENFCKIGCLNRNWLLTSPNNDNERDGKVMMFRNKELRCRLEENLRSVFRKGTYRVNEVLKWNRYTNGGKFHDHFDTMFVNKSSEECSLYTLLIYIEVELEDNFLYLGDEELKVPLKSDWACIIPHWVKHRVIGTGLREFIKAEIVFKNKHIGITYDQSIADAFDKSCYYMLQSVRHPELKDFVSRSFNKINEARFYKTEFIPSLYDHIFLLKTMTIPLKYFDKKRSVEFKDLMVSFIADGKYYYFKTRKEGEVTPNEAVVILSIMYLDVHPKRIFTRAREECDCGADYCIHREHSDRYQQCSLKIDESVFYWRDEDIETQMNRSLFPVQFPCDLKDIESVANVSVLDIKDNARASFYFAAYYETYYETKYQAFMTDITAIEQDGNYNGLNVSFIGRDKNIVKIRQSSFGNGMKVEKTWKYITVSEFIDLDGPLSDDEDSGSAYDSAEEATDKENTTSPANCSIW